MRPAPKAQTSARMTSSPCTPASLSGAGAAVGGEHLRAGVAGMRAERLAESLAWGSARRGVLLPVP